MSDFMFLDPITVQARDPLRIVQARMNQTGAGHLPVLDGVRVVGFVTARDIARSMPVPLTALSRAEVERLLAIPVSMVMSTPVVELPPDARVGMAVAQMAEHGVGAVVVVDPEDGRLVGLLTRSTILRMFSRAA